MARRGFLTSPLTIAALACVTLALASLALPSGVGYDQYAWLIWGRDLAHLQLSLAGSGTSWKPLPPLIDALLTPLGAHAIYGWLVVARAGALLAIVMAFRLGWRLAAPRGRLVAGLIAAVSIALTQGWLRHAGTGNSEGLLVAFGLLAIDRHLDGHRAQALWLLAAAGLVRVEMWPFTAAYALWLSRRGSTRTRSAAAVAVVVGPLLWFGGDWLGSGRLTTGSDRALQRVPDSAATTAHPALTVFQEAYALLPPSAWLALVAGLVAALARRRLTPLVVLAAGALAWTVVVAAMAERGYPGLPRFLFMAAALDAVAAGLGAALVVDKIARHRRAAAAVVTAAFALGALPNARLLRLDVAGIRAIARTDTTLATSVQHAGGPDALLDCGRPSSPWYVATAVAWDLGISPDAVHRHPPERGPVRFERTGGGWQLLEARRCRLVAAQATQIRHRPADQQREHHARNA